MLKKKKKRFTIANYEDQHLSTKNKFKPIYSKKYQVREKTNLEPLIPMGDQEIISPYYINTICSKVYSRPFFFLSNWHVSDCDRNAEVYFGGEKKKNNNEKKKKKMSARCTSLPEFCDWFFSTGITDFANYNLRKYPLYDLMRWSIWNVPGPLQFKLEDHFVHRDHIRISCTDVKFSPRVWLALRARLALTFERNINLSIR